MKELILVIVGAALVNNIILSQFQGLCPFLGVSKKVDTSCGYGRSRSFCVIVYGLYCDKPNLYLYLVPTRSYLSADHCIYAWLLQLCRTPWLRCS